MKIFALVCAGVLLSVNTINAADKGTFRDGYQAGSQMATFEHSVRSAELLKELVAATKDERMKSFLNEELARTIVQGAEAFERAEESNKKFAMVDPVAFKEGYGRMYGKLVRAKARVDASTLRDEEIKTKLAAVK